MQAARSGRAPVALAPLARAVEEDDEDIRLLSAGRAWAVALSIMVLSGLAVFEMRALLLPKPLVAGTVLLASIAGPLVAAARGHIMMDRVVPYAGVLGVLGLIFFNVCISLGGYTTFEPFYPGRGHLEGPLLWWMAFAGVPVGSIVGGVLGCVVHRRRHGASSKDAELLL